MAITREVERVFKGIPASDGAGVQLTRIIGSPYINMLDPFLLLDHFHSDKPQDYIAGFPPHPHRGFETVTYMLDGKMQHEDSAGNSGVIESGGVQWMTAGRGIIHSEMPLQENGLLSGFQLWVNLPAEQKMSQPNYQEHNKKDIPVESYNENVEIKVIAGKTQNGTIGVIDNSYVDPIYWVISQKAGAILSEKIAEGHNAFIYVYAGSVILSGASDIISQGQLAVLTNGDLVKIAAIDNAKYLLIAGKPLGEPVARGGPFVMNTRDEVNQAFSEYQAGTFAKN
ncbi:pirin family protein [Glaciecola petra]|uniref:Pirin family protein n=1 Tax=Glaciecola petra TaxID=3075602 RepID=A0ABU2ZRM5_9ALTE|nr:pirin family protein [Aestuariibacter sp. P117]MDT0595291.1 pirin family protein [Aestuariibacter sp. P117]